MYTRYGQAKSTNQFRERTVALSHQQDPNSSHLLLRPPDNRRAYAPQSYPEFPLPTTRNLSLAEDGKTKISIQNVYIILSFSGILSLSLNLRHEQVVWRVVKNELLYPFSLILANCCQGVYTRKHQVQLIDYLINQA